MHKVKWSNTYPSAGAGAYMCVALTNVVILYNSLASYARLLMLLQSTVTVTVFTAAALALCACAAAAPTRATFPCDHVPVTMRTADAQLCRDTLQAVQLHMLPQSPRPPAHPAVLGVTAAASSGAMSASSSTTAPRGVELRLALHYARLKFDEDCGCRLAASRLLNIMC